MCFYKQFQEFTVLFENFIMSTHNSDSQGTQPLVDQQLKKASDAFTDNQSVATNDNMYKSPTSHFKSEQQNKLDLFMQRYGDSGIARFRKDQPGADDDSDETVEQKEQRKIGLNEALAFMSKAPPDATGCSKIQSLNDFVKGQQDVVKNPKNAFFDLSRKYYIGKYDDKDNKKEIHVMSYLLLKDGSNYVKDLSMDIIQTNQGCMPIVKTFEWNSYNKDEFVKALKFYNYRGDCALRRQFVADTGFMNHDFKTYDTSVLHFGNSIIFYQRKDKWHKLMQYNVVQDELIELEEFVLEEPVDDGIKYHIMFSSEFGQSRERALDQKNNEKTVYAFLEGTFIICQTYQLDERLKYTNKELVIFKIEKGLITRLGGPGTKQKPLKEAIQYVGHKIDIKVNAETGLEEETGKITFQGVDPFSTHEFVYYENECASVDPSVRGTYTEFTSYEGNNEIQIKNIDKLRDPPKEEIAKFQKTKQVHVPGTENDFESVATYDEDELNQFWRHTHLAPFLKHQNPQFLIQKDFVTLTKKDEFDVAVETQVEQFYYITNDNQFQLVYPNYKDLNKKHDVIFQIAKNHQYNQNPDVDYDYDDDFNQRQKDFADCKYKKISHVCSESWRSKNHMKKADHLKMILDYPRDLNIHDKIILSTDQERSNIYVYQSHKITGENLIEIYNYENNIAYAEGVRTLPQLVYMTSTKEKQLYKKKKATSRLGGRSSSIGGSAARASMMSMRMSIGGGMSGFLARQQEIQEDNDSYYINAKYRHIVSSKTHIQTLLVDKLNDDVEDLSIPMDQKFLSHRLEPHEKESFWIVEGKNGRYYNIRYKADDNRSPDQIITPEVYYRNQFYYVFVFSLANISDALYRKHNYFFIKKTISEVEELGLDNHQSIIRDDQEVTVVVGNDMVGKPRHVLERFTHNPESGVMLYSDLVTYQKEVQDYQVKLTFEYCLDMKDNINFIPVIFQQKDLAASHNLLLFDIYKMKFVYKICINPNLEKRKFIRKSLSGFVKYQFIRTSDVYEQDLYGKQLVTNRNKKLEQGKAQTAKYQITMQFYLVDEKEVNPARCTVELNEYIVQYRPAPTVCYMLLVGKKNLALAMSAQKSRYETFDELLVLPYITRKQEFKGSLLALKEEAKQVDEEIFNNEHRIEYTDLDYSRLKVINLQDQQINNLYHQQSEMLQFGHQKYLLNEYNHEEYILIATAQLRQRIYMNGNLETSETYYILNKIQKKHMSMQLAKFEYFVLNDDFDQLVREEFYQGQEVLEGKTICDLCLTFPKEIALGLRQKQSVYKEIDGSLIEEVCQGLENEDYHFYVKADLCEENLVVQVDFNFCSTLRIAMELNQNQSIKMLLAHLFEKNNVAYTEIMMLELPKFLHFPLISRIYEFLDRDHDEKMAILEDQEKNYDGDQKAHEFCNFEDFLNDPKLPAFQTASVQYHQMERFKDFHNYEKEITQEAIVKDAAAAQAGEQEKNIEAEHSLIDFQKVIIGEKIRGFQEESFRNIKFDHIHLAKMIWIEDEDKMDFYNLEVARKLIDFQFEHTRVFMNQLLKGYICGFLLPLFVSMTATNIVILNLCYTMCFFVQFFFIIFEVVRMWEQRLAYFGQFFNWVDLAQFLVFQMLYTTKMYNQFETDSTFEIGLQAIIIFQSFFKVFYYLRIYEQFHFILTMAYYVAREVAPFMIFTISMMIGFAKMYQLLNAGVNDPDGLYENIKSEFYVTMFETYVAAKGKSKPPILNVDKVDAEEDPFYATVLFFLITIIWAMEQGFYGIMLTYYVAMLMQQFEKHYAMMPTYEYRTKSKFNEEVYPILQLFYPEKCKPFKVVFFSMDKNPKTDGWLGLAKANGALCEGQKNALADKEKEASKERDNLRNVQIKNKDLLQRVAAHHATMTSNLPVYKNTADYVVQVAGSSNQQPAAQRYSQYND